MESIEIRITKLGIIRGNLPKKIKRSPDERYKETRGNLNDVFRHSRKSFSMRRYIH